jgi:glycosyltransferase involved in cell wall biosynthesis
MSEPVLWSSNPLMTKHFGLLGERLSVFDAVDDWSEHPQKARMRRPILDGYQTARQRATVIFTVSKALADRLGVSRDNVHWLPNGVEIERFSGDTAPPSSMASLPGPVLGYVGTLQERVDVEMLLAVAKRMPHASVALVGPIVSPAHFQRLKTLKNVHFLGAKSAAEVPAFVEAFDVCLMPHVDNNFTRSMDPMKLYEYLAAGKPVVVSGPLDPALSGVVRHAWDPDGFAAAVEQSLTAHDTNGPTERRAYAQSHSWDCVVEEMVSTIKLALVGRPEQGPVGALT